MLLVSDSRGGGRKGKVVPFSFPPGNALKGLTLGSRTESPPMHHLKSLGRQRTALKTWGRVRGEDHAPVKTSRSEETNVQRKIQV